MKEILEKFSDFKCQLLLQENRLHLHHGPIDIIAHVEAPEEIRKCLYESASKRLSTVLEELVSELDLLKLPWSKNHPEPRGSIARKMLNAVNGSMRFITPMAAVAGAVAEEIMETMILEANSIDTSLESIRRMYVNNGGDISFWLNSGDSFTIGVVENTETPELNTKVCLPYESPVRGVATSGWRGRSQSLGIADAVTVLASSSANADAAATLIANDVNAEYPGIVRIPACEVKDDSDLGMRLVTVDVPQLPERIISQALQCGAQTVRELISKEKINSAYLSLQKQTLIIENNLTEMING
ncbi:MAG: hypothetical protein MAG581_01204 [Deltaproteobacteria bacterium]|nr:hypothetical protein [Deltaproteobacteria bacterium]